MKRVLTGRRIPKSRKTETKSLKRPAGGGREEACSSWQPCFPHTARWLADPWLQARFQPHTHIHTHTTQGASTWGVDPHTGSWEKPGGSILKKKIPKLTFYLNFYEYHPCKSINTMTASPKFTASHSQTWYRSTRLILFVDPVEIGINSTACLFQYIELFVWV